MDTSAFTIVEEISRLEKLHDIKIIYAAEAGSRAWGFESKDSDYDIRFLYIRKLSHYLSVKKKNDTIQYMDGLFDYHGWDIKKVISLLAVQNVQLWEWLESPVVYRYNNSLKRYVFDKFNGGLRIDRVVGHYKGISNNAINTFRKDGSVKKFMYALRCACCIEYIKAEREMPPVEFKKLVEKLFIRDSLYSKGLKEAALYLIERKKQANEHDRLSIPKPLVEWVMYSLDNTPKYEDTENEDLSDDFLNILKQYPAMNDVFTLGAI